MIHAWNDARWLYSMMSDDGRRVIIVAERGAIASMYILDLGNAMAPDVSAPLVPLLGDVEAMHTPISSVDTNLEHVGYRGAALLDELMAGKRPSGEPVRLPPARLISSDCSKRGSAFRYSRIAR